MRGAAGLTILLAALTSCHRDLRPNERWLELSSDHFVLRTDLEEEAARSTLRELEQLRATFLAAFAWGGESLPAIKPTQVLELAELAELREFAREGTEGFVAPIDPSERLVVLSAEQGPSLQPTLKHELAHAMAALLLRRQPAWFAEGLACALESTRRDRERQRDIVGERNEPRLRWLARHAPMPAAEAFAVESALSLEQGAAARFESSAYAIVQLLLEQRPGPLTSYMQRLAAGDEPQGAFASLFPDLTPARLDELLGDGLQRDAPAAPRTVPLLVDVGPISVRALSGAELHALRSQLFALSPGLIDRAAAARRALDEVRQALLLEPGNPEALEVAIGLGQLQGRARLEAARRSVALHPDSWRAQVLLAKALAEPSAESEAMAPQPGEQPDAHLADRHDAVDAERLAAWRSAVRLAPNEPHLLAQLGLELANRERALAAAAERPIAAEARTAIEQPPSRISCPARGPALGAPLPHGDLAAEVRYTVGDDGLVRSVSRVSGSERLVVAIRKWLLSCSFQPGRRGGHPVFAEVRELFTFPN